MKKLVITSLFFAFIIAGCAEIKSVDIEQAVVDIKPSQVFYPHFDDKWIGIGISYGSYRDGEGPDQGSVSSKEHILEDLMILTTKGSRSWNLIRMYGADSASEQVLDVIKENNVPMQVMLGAWLSSHQFNGDYQ